MSSRIEQIIEEIEEFVESCKYQPLSTTKIVVNKEELEELLRELRLKTPDEIKRYQKIISNKDAILADAQAKADSLIAEAQAKTKEMVSQHEVMQQAYAQANEPQNNMDPEVRNRHSRFWMRQLSMRIISAWELFPIQMICWQIWNIFLPLPSTNLVRDTESTSHQSRDAMILLLKTEVNWPLRMTQQLFRQIYRTSAMNCHWMVWIWKNKRQMDSVITV